MANTKSAKKAIRVSKRKNIINLRTRRKYKEARKVVAKAVTLKKVKEAKKLLPKAYKELDRAVKKNVLKKNTAARYKSRLAKSIAKQEK